MKTTVDQFKPGQRIPHCHLKAEVTSNHEMSAPKLFHQVKLVGAKLPYNIVTINLDSQETPPGQNTPLFSFYVWYIKLMVYGFYVESMYKVCVKYILWAALSDMGLSHLLSVYSSPTTGPLSCTCSLPSPQLVVVPLRPDQIIICSQIHGF